MDKSMYRISSYVVKVFDDKLVVVKHKSKKAGFKISKEEILELISQSERTEAFQGYIYIF